MRTSSRGFLPSILAIHRAIARSWSNVFERSTQSTLHQATPRTRDLAEVWIKIEDVLEMTGARPQALDNYRKARETLEALSAAIPADAVIRGMLTEVRHKEAQKEQRTQL